MSVHRAARAAIAAMGIALHVSDAATCPNGVTVPTVNTVMASRLKPDKEAWIVTPDCTFTTTFTGGDGTIGLASSPNVARIESVPSATTKVFAMSQGLSRGADLSGAINLKEIVIMKFELGFVENLKLPSTVHTLNLLGPTGGSIDNLNLPDSLVSLTMIGLGISSFKYLPSSITFMSLPGNAFPEINFPIPPNLKYLSMDNSPMRKLERVTFPDTLTSFSCQMCGITEIRGVKWPSQISLLYLRDNPIREFEVRQSDFDLFSELSAFDLSSNSEACSDAQAELKTVNGYKLCVISDKRFYDLYGGVAPPDSPSSGSSEGSASASASGEGFSSGTGSEANINNSRAGTNGSGGAIAEATNGQLSDGEEGPSDINGEGDTNESKQTNVIETSSMSPTVIGMLVGVSTVIVVLLAAVSYRLLRSSRRTQEEAAGPADDSRILVDTPAFSTTQNSSSLYGGSTQEYLSNDIRNDKAIIPYRVDQKKVSLHQLIARGAFAVIFRGVYGGRSVAVKQMLPDAWQNESQLINFMDEIRMCASLSHPRIVEFVGVAWTSLRDVSVISEFMAGGDLLSVLQRHAQAQPSSPSTAGPAVSLSQSPSSLYVPSSQDWSEMWTAASIKSKTLIAKDVAEAIVFLHSFSTPILHRNLKARNVLLDTRGNAKLSGFGINREIAIDETVKSEMGNSAWIAPEVLRGDRYSECADMYAFGVLLVELDTCGHPYAGNEVLLHAANESELAQHEQQQSAQHQNMQIARLVSEGNLQPRPSATCPARIEALIARCLSFAPEDRPTAMEGHYEMRQIVAEQKEARAKI